MYKPIFITDMTYIEGYIHIYILYICVYALLNILKHKNIIVSLVNLLYKISKYVCTQYFAQMYTKIFENSEGGYQPMIHEQSHEEYCSFMHS